VRDAATVLLVDDHQSGWRVYMVKRHHKNAFMANAHVFVGGRVDDEDSSAEIATRVTRPSAGMLAERLGLPAAQKARALGLYVAAIREAFEECGLLLAKRRDGQWIGNDNGDQRLLNQAREALNSATLSFAELLVEHDLWLDLQAMRYLAHWITPPWEPKLYDTRFFVARAPAGQCARFDPKETTEGQWTRPADALAAARKGAVYLAPPTLCVLEDLLDAKDASAAIARASDSPVIAIRPRLLADRTPVTIVLPDDYRYNDPSAARATGALEHYLERHGKSWVRFRRG
jgi:8-oxo-dGTP pyrophosphatase MutT (NUDIX family)